jgi:hypothetical protein
MFTADGLNSPIKNEVADCIQTYKLLYTVYQRPFRYEDTKSLKEQKKILHANNNQKRAGEWLFYCQIK